MTKFNCCYMTALKIVANDFNIVKDKNREQNKPLLKYTGSKIEEKTVANIQVELKDYTDKELKWWASFGISRETLDKYDVYSIKNVFVNGDLTYLYKPNQLVFGYYGGKTDDVELWKIYFPNKQNMRFMSNWNKNKLQGYDQLPKEAGFIVCTKAMKDVMLLSELEVPAVAPMSETVFMSESQYAKLKERYNRTFLLFDNDLPGISNANKIRKKFPDIQVLIIPRNSGSKDITDYYRDHGKEKTIQLIEQAKSFYL